MLDYILTAVGTVLIPILTFVYKNINTRFKEVEVQLAQTVTEKTVRQIIDDKISPIREDIKEINQKLDKILDLYLLMSRERK